MSKVPSLNYPVVVSAFQRAGWVVVRQRGSHIRMQRHTPAGLRKVTVVAHKPIKRSTLAKLLKDAEISVERRAAARAGPYGTDGRHCHISRSGSPSAGP